MTLVGPQARACCSACNGKRWPRAEPFSVVLEEYRCHMRCLSCMMHVRLVGYTKKEKQQLDMNVCVQTNESKGPLCLWEDDWWGRDLPPSLFLSGLTPRLSPAVRGRDTQMGCSLSSLSLLSLFHYLPFTPISIHTNSAPFNSTQ